MGIETLFGRKKEKRGPSAAQIRKEEETKIRQENLTAQKAQEERRRSLRSRLVAGEDEEELQRKVLLGE